MEAAGAVARGVARGTVPARLRLEGHGRGRGSRSLRHPVATDLEEYEVRGVPESRRFCLQGDGGEEPGRDPERFGLPNP